MKVFDGSKNGPIRLRLAKKKFYILSGVICHHLRQKNAYKSIKTIKILGALKKVAQFLSIAIVRSAYGLEFWIGM